MELPTPFVAKAEFKASVSTTIPETSSGKFVDALTDCIRPVSEYLGLRADRIKLQRESVAIEITKKANERIALEGRLPEPVNLKVLIPLLEKGSCEDPDNLDMIERWACLLANNSVHPEICQPRFTQILAEITSPQARLLARIASNENRSKESVIISPLPESIAKAQIAARLKALRNTDFSDKDAVKETIVRCLDVSGNLISKIGWHLRTVQCPACNSGMVNTIHNFQDQTNPIDLSVLYSLSLVDRVNFRMSVKTEKSEVFVMIEYNYITELGMVFLRAVDNKIKSICPKRRYNL